MRLRTLALLALLAPVFACGERERVETVPTGTALIDVNVLDLATGTMQPNMTVVVDGPRVTHVSAPDGLQLAANVRQILLTDTYVIPGLWDMHAHTYADAETRGLFLPAFVAHGVTGIRDMFADCYEACAGSDGRSMKSIREALHPSAAMGQSWSDDIAAGRLAGPRMVRSSYIMNGGTGFTWRSGRVVDGVADARDAVMTAAQRGVEFLKVYPALGRDEFFEIARLADSLSLPLAGHVPFSVTPEEASDAGMDSFEHLNRLGVHCVRDAEQPDEGAGDRTPADQLRNLTSPEACSDTFATLASNGTHIVPTLASLGAYGNLGDPSFASDPRRRYLPAYLLTLWDNAREGLGITDDLVELMKARHDIHATLVRAAHNAGVPVLAGSDVPNPNMYPGSSLHDELEELVHAGLSPLEALRTATVNPARFLDREHDLGSVTVGKLADLVVLSANPMDDIRRIRQIELVVTNGRVYTRGDLDRLLAAIEEFSAGWSGR